MLKVKLSNGLIILGVDKENIYRLVERDEPMVLSLKDVGGTDEICIMYGDTLKDIQNYIEQASGKKFPKSIDEMALEESRNNTKQ